MATPPSQSRRLPLAITGGIASGKSTVLAQLSQLGLPVWSADESVKQAYSDPEVLERIERSLPGIDLDDRAGIRAEVLKNQASRRRLNAVLHPLVVASMVRQDAVAFEVPLLIEACLHPLFKHVWLVSCPEQERLRRLHARGIEPETARLMMAAQLPDRAKMPFATAIIRTDRDIESVHRTVAQLATQARLAG